MSPLFYAAVHRRQTLGSKIARARPKRPARITELPAHVNDGTGQVKDKTRQFSSWPFALENLLRLLHLLLQNFPASRPPLQPLDDSKLRQPPQRPGRIGFLEDQPQFRGNPVILQLLEEGAGQGIDDPLLRGAHDTEIEPLFEADSPEDPRRVVDE